MLRVTVMAVALATSTHVTSAHAQVQDTIFRKSTLLTGKDVLLAGAFAAGTALLGPLDARIAARLQNPGTQENKFLNRSATGLKLLGIPGSFAIGAVVYVIGRANGHPRTQSLGLHSVESVLLADILGVGIKLAAGRQRPNVDVSNPSSFQLWRGLRGDAYQSFPSGHTISAFAFASSVTRETQFWSPHSAWYVGTLFYGGAALVGASRMYNNMHWATDVMAGAAIGTIVGLKVVTYTHSHPGNGIDRKLIKSGRHNGVQASPILFTIQF